MEEAHDCRTRQLCELEALEAMYGLDDSFVNHDPDALAELQQLMSSTDGQDNQQVDTKLVLSFSIKKKDAAVPALCHSVRFTLPPLYPNEPAAARIEWEVATRGEAEELNGVLRQYAGSLAGEEAGMQLLEKAAELVTEVWEEKESVINSAEQVRQLQELERHEEVRSKNACERPCVLIAFDL
jgi:hypothetical protein